jgi:predicted protein tyrosine phosphatase
MAINILFVCSRNEWRSPTAETIYKNNTGLNVRSVGTSAVARIKINAATIAWAEVIFVMEKKHRQLIQQRFPTQIIDKEIILLNIPDEYQYMDEELVEDIKTKVNSYLNIED